MTYNRMMQARWVQIIGMTVIAALAFSPILRSQDVFSSGGESGEIVSITPFFNGRCDVKIKNPITGYVHSVTILCDLAAGFQAGDCAVATKDPNAPLQKPNPALPRVNASGDAGPQFTAAVKGCLAKIQCMAMADRGSPINRLLAALTSIPVTIHPRPPTDTSNATASSPPGQPVDIYWSPTDSGRYTDGASKIPCATLLHELTHAWENYNGLDNGELQAVRSENWFIWRQRGTQRTQYSGTPLPPGQVVWPQAATPPPR